jgi:hypothetical protein
MPRKSRWSQWRDERGRFVRVTREDVLNAMRDDAADGRIGDRRVVLERPARKRAPKR